jgi:flagellar hook-length control protein FliK
MSIQPLTIASPPAEAGPRRRAAEREPAERESFVLPPDEPAREAPPAPRERREASAETNAPARDGREPVRSVEARRPRDDEAKTAAAEEAASAAASDATTGETIVPEEPVQAAKPMVAAAAAKAASVTKTDLDVAALVTIAEATQGDASATVAAAAPGAPPAPAGGPALLQGKAAEAIAETDEAGDPPEASESDGSALVMPLDLATPEPAPAVPVQLAIPVPAGTTRSEATAGTQAGDVLAGKGGAAATAQAAAAIAARMPAAMAADPQSVSGQAAGPEATGAAAPRPGGDASSAAVALAAEPVQAQKAEAVAPGLPANGEVAAKPEAAAAAPATATAEFKPLERLDQALSAIDLSSLTAQGSARPDSLRLLSTPDSILTQAPVQPGNTTKEGTPTPLHVLPIEIGLKALSGARQFDIRLDPGELGRVDVTLSISDAGEVSAKMVVDRVETLHLLQRDARTLERAFEQAGLKPSEGGVDISLRDPSDQSGFRQPRQQDDAPQRRRGSASGAELSDDISVTPLAAPQHRYVRLGGVDVSV